MSKPQDRQDEIDSAAADWVVRLEGAPLTPAEQLALESWLQADSAHASTLAEARATLARLDGLRDAPELASKWPAPSWPPAAEPPASRPAARRVWAPVAAAAACLMLFIAAGVLWFGNPAALLLADHRTAPGEIRTIGLSDGSSVLLGPASAIAVGYSENERTVELLEGVAYFAQPALRWLYFLSGIAGTVMVASGLVLWTVKRAKNQPASFGRRLVLGLNVGGVAGLMAANAIYFWANRLVPAGLPGRIDWEIGAFFLSWTVLLLYPLVRSIRRAWVEQLMLGGVLFAGLPVLNALTSQSNLLKAVTSGDWMLAGFDLVAVVTGITLCYAARRIAMHQPKATPRRRQQAEEEGETPVLAPQGAAE